MGIDAVFKHQASSLDCTSSVANILSIKLKDTYTPFRIFVSHIQTIVHDIQDTIDHTKRSFTLHPRSMGMVYGGPGHRFLLEFARRYDGNDFALVTWCNKMKQLDPDDFTYKNGEKFHDTIIFNSSSYGTSIGNKVIVAMLKMDIDYKEN